MIVGIISKEFSLQILSNLRIDDTKNKVKILLFYSFNDYFRTIKLVKKLKSEQRRQKTKTEISNSNSNSLNDYITGDNLKSRRTLKTLRIRMYAFFNEKRSLGKIFTVRPLWQKKFQGKQGSGQTPKKMTKVQLSKLKKAFDHKDSISQRQAVKKFDISQQMVSQNFAFFDKY
ncbi:hypothetical protein BpHYR1_017625 [Brachionus plicatilis]|uniref:Uncharacterized protein n=1 Tax=Brachionus plicatilis TaxID=10195 RepID=A0A3M7SDK7_BRAPC|nr:hypothetical protein BpHYR1_017625 [Brachionus plicatilis]